ncbi:MAG: ribose 5-phosphate isomerase B [Clostridia bacterium]|nr:ribose 5-phosphate isomerase B [Clostridia bacterium]
MKIAIGNDHAAVVLKQHIVKYLEAKGHEVMNLGIDVVERTDYPKHGAEVARAVAAGKAERGIVICGTGVGISLAANKVRGIRCACVSEPVSAKMCRAHNNCNMIAFGERIVGPQLAEAIVDAFIETEPEGGRHAERVEMIMAIEAEEMGK